MAFSSIALCRKYFCCTVVVENSKLFFVRVVEPERFCWVLGVDTSRIAVQSVILSCILLLIFLWRTGLIFTLLSLKSPSNANVSNRGTNFHWVDNHRPYCYDLDSEVSHTTRSFSSFPHPKLCWHSQNAMSVHP